MNYDLLKQQLIRDEGKRNLAYQDSKGIWTVGVGHNLQTKPLSDNAVGLIFNDDLNEHVALLDKYLPWWRNLDEVRQRALVNFAFNLGVGPSQEDKTGKLLTFNQTLELLKAGDYQAVAGRLVKTPWYSQVGARAKRIIHMFETGTDP